MSLINHYIQSKINYYLGDNIEDKVINGILICNYIKLEIDRKKIKEMHKKVLSWILKYSDCYTVLKYGYGILF